MRKLTQPAALVAVACTWTMGCTESPPAPAPARADTIESTPLRAALRGSGALFTSLTPEQTGVEFENRFDWDNPRKHLYQHGYAGGGVCVGDYDGDGRPDLYLVSQVGRDRLYRQVGDLRFEDATDSAGVAGGGDWGTGAVFADVDGDGDLDLYVCNYDAANLLYVNQGDGTFAEQASAAGIDFSGASVMAGFADYDLDGDLDLYLLTNRLYPGPGLDTPQTVQVSGQAAVAPGYEEAFAIQTRNVRGRMQKFVVKAGQRDRLFRNDGSGGFTDVSAEAGVSGNHPGLSATWWDFDDNGLPDLYVCNDFWDPDRLYRNNGDGTFTDVLGQTVPHTPWFSMGSDIADVNNDGRMDLLAADMSATTHYMSKLMMGDMADSRWFLESARPRQYMRNALYLNTGTDRFMEVAYLANLASTDWTWSVKFGDLDNDGMVDLFVTNGTANHSFDPDLTRRLREVGRRRSPGAVADPRERWDAQWRLYREVPPRRETNLAFRNAGDLRFERVDDRWGLAHSGISFGAAYADLDRDGDLDIIVNNIDDPASIYRNDGGEGHRLLVRLRGVESNRFGIGATLTVTTADGSQMRYLTVTRGYMSANEPVVHFGLGAAREVASLVVRWPSGRRQRFERLAADRLYVVTEPSGPTGGVPDPPPTQPSFAEVAVARGLDTGSSRERPYNDYLRQPLLPAKLSQLGPGLAWGDADGDGDDDLFVGGPAGRAGRLFVNGGDGSFAEAGAGPWVDDKRSEDMAPLWLDVDGDGDLDLYVASGSVECQPGDPILADRLYLNDGAGGFTKAPPAALPDARHSSSVVTAADFDVDGDLDLFVGARVIPGAYPLTPVSRLLRNEGGYFTDVTDTLAPGLADAGLVTSALWSDVDGDALPDLLVTAEWGPVAYWHNGGGRFDDRTGSSGLADRLGWWNAVTGADLDGDGDTDYVVMNAGLNTKYHATPDKPALLFYGDFEGNGKLRLLEAKPDHQTHLPVRGLSCLSTAMPFVWRRTPSFHEFAAATVQDIFPEQGMASATVFTATTLESGVLLNDGGVFTWQALPRLAQASPGFGVASTDFDADGDADVYIAQNFFWREPETGHWDGGLSQMLHGDGSGALTPVAPADSGLIVTGDATALAVCDVDGDGRPDVTVARNNDRLLIFRNEHAADSFGVRLDGPPGNPHAVGARVTVTYAGGRAQSAEVYAGSGYLSQSVPTLFFGRDGATAMRVRWPDGTRTTHTLEPGAATITLRR